MAKILKGPKGFVTLKGFFERLGGTFAAVAPSKAEKASLVSRLEQIEEESFFPCDGVTEDLMYGAEVRELRRYEGGTEFVRFEVQGSRADGDCDSPCQLLTQWNADGGLEAYTFISGAGRKPRSAASLHTEHGGICRDRFVEDVGEAVAFVGRMKGDDAAIVGNDDCDGEFISVSREDGELVLSWQVFGAPWSFNSAREISVADARAAILKFCDEGIAGVQEFCDWEIADRYDAVSKMATVNVDLSLRRMLKRALRTGDVLVARTLEAIGVRPEGVFAGDGGPYEERIPFCDKGTSIELLYDRTCPPENMKDGHLNKLLAYVALHGNGHGIHNLAERFENGDTVEKKLGEF